MRLADLLGGLDVALAGADAVEVDAVRYDSREVRPGSLFCCVPGATYDGHDFAPAAIRNGAVALLVEHMLDGVNVTQVCVPSVRATMAVIAAILEGHPSRQLRVLGVTGTNGKTTTTYLLEAIARAAGDRVGVIGTIETRIDGAVEAAGRTTPEGPDVQRLLARMRDGGVATVAMEVSSHALEQYRVEGIRFAAACFTNLSLDHLDYHGDLERYFAAKATLFDSRFTRAAVVNIDDPRGVDIVAQSRRQHLDVTTFSTQLDGAADVVARGMSLAPDCTRFELVDHRRDQHAQVCSTLVGPFNISNLVAAAATALAVEVPLHAIAAGLSSDVVVPGRFERVAGAPFPIIVDYAHTPDALERVLAAARSLVQPEGRLIVVFGCGGDRDRLKRPLMGAAAAAHSDLAIVTSDNPRSEPPDAIIAEILSGVVDRSTTMVELDRRCAIRAALVHAMPGDVVVIAGKGHETEQNSAGVTIPFDDRTVAREESEALACR